MGYDIRKKVNRAVQEQKPSPGGRWPAAGGADEGRYRVKRGNA